MPPPPPPPPKKIQFQEEQFELLLKTSQPFLHLPPYTPPPLLPLHFSPSISSPPPNEIVFN